MFKNLFKHYKGKYRENMLLLGTPGAGKGYHPWDNLKQCPCGCEERPLLMYEKEKLYVCGGITENVFAICSVCGRHTAKSELSIAIDNWNTDIIVNIGEIELS